MSTSGHKKNANHSDHKCFDNFDMLPFIFRKQISLNFVYERVGVQLVYLRVGLNAEFRYFE